MKEDGGIFFHTVNSSSLLLAECTFKVTSTWNCAPSSLLQNITPDFYDKYFSFKNMQD